MPTEDNIKQIDLDIFKIINKEKTRGKGLHVQAIEEEMAYEKGTILANKKANLGQDYDRIKLLESKGIDLNLSYEAQERLLAEKQGIKGLWNSISKDRNSDFGIEVFFIIGFAILVFLLIKSKLK